ncbi:MAG: AtpZ/AtpI family protein [Planctomycetes bacterium]|nr:AtpZ/AtpI family protein [Planctomycetota bacterium]
MPRNAWDRGADALGAALTMALAVALFTWGGYRLDLALGSSPLFVFAGAMLGVVGGFLHLVRVLAPELRLFRKKGRDGPPARDADPQDTDSR